MTDSYKSSFSLILPFVGFIWLVFFLDFLLPLEYFGVRPRTFSGLLGIVGSPFIHRDIYHLISNSIPLIILLGLLVSSKSESWSIVIMLIVASGALLWVFGRSANHIGASGLVFALITYLIFAGYFEQKVMSIIIAVIVLFVYGGTILSGFIPRSGVSWDGHLLGAVAGFLVAYLTLKK